jgi:hypothetical protein
MSSIAKSAMSGRADAPASMTGNAQAMTPNPSAIAASTSG